MHDRPEQNLVSDELLTVSDLAQILKCKESSVYNLSRKRSARYKHQLRFIRAPFGLRVRRSDLDEWLEAMADGAR